MLHKIVYVTSDINFINIFWVQWNRKWEPLLFCRGCLKLVHIFVNFYDHLNIIWRHIQCPIYPFKTKIKAFLLHCILCFGKSSSYLRDQFYQPFVSKEIENEILFFFAEEIITDYWDILWLFEHSLKAHSPN